MPKCIESVEYMYVYKVYEHFRENVGFTRKDMYNSLSRSRRESIINNEGAAQLFEHFMKIASIRTFEWHKCLLYCQDNEEFETTWKQMVDEYNITKKHWFNLIIDI